MARLYVRPAEDLERLAGELGPVGVDGRPRFYDLRRGRVPFASDTNGCSVFRFMNVNGRRAFKAVNTRGRPRFGLSEAGLGFDPEGGLV